MEEQVFFTPEEVAQKLGVTPKTVREWLKSGILNGYKLGTKYRITAEDLQSYLDRSRIENT